MSDQDDATWTFGAGGFCKIYGNRLAQSSLLDAAVATRWVFVYMLSQADALGRYRCATVPALARAANVSLPQARKAVQELEAPDPQSTSKDHEGRRILAIRGGWQVVNFTTYRDFRTMEQEAAAERKRRQREKEEAERDKSRDVPLGHSDDRADVRRQTSDDRNGDGLPADADADAAPNGLPPSAGGPASPAAGSRHRKVSAAKPANGNGAMKRATGWVSRAGDMLRAKRAGTGDYGRIGKELAPLVLEHGEEEVLARWARYVEGSSYYGPHAFAVDFGKWAAGAALATTGRWPSVGEVAMAEALKARRT